MAWYPTQSYYPATEPTSPFPILIMLSAWQGSDKYQSLLCLDQGSKPWSSGQRSSKKVYSFWPSYLVIGLHEFKSMKALAICSAKVVNLQTRLFLFSSFSLLATPLPVTFAQHTVLTTLLPHSPTLLLSTDSPQVLFSVLRLTELLILLTGPCRP